MQSTSFYKALPFWVSMFLVPVLAFSGYLGGWWMLLTPLYAFWLIGIIDEVAGLELKDKDPNTPDEQLFWYRLLTIIWFPIECIVIYGGIAYATYSAHLAGIEKWYFMICIGIVSGGIGIVFAHELMHQKPKVERHMADGLMALTLYGHFRSEHLLVHHKYVATPKDAVTARYNEGFHRYFPRVIRQSLFSSWDAEKVMLARKNLSPLHFSNPFWKYAALQLLALYVAYLIAGWMGVALFCVQAFMAILLLEATNYVEHYGLTRRHLGDGKYEHVMPHHSWNSAYKMSNFMLINLQRHSDHHYKPSRRFPLLQNFQEDEAPQLPKSYSVMIAIAFFPPLWKKIMNPRVKAWRKRFYPDIEDWHSYNKALNPLPKR